MCRFFSHNDSHNIAGVQAVLHERVQWMFGEASKDFHDRVSHLVAGEVGSNKYIVAAQLGKHIMTPDWVDAVWDTARFTYVTLHRHSHNNFRSTHIIK